MSIEMLDSVQTIIGKGCGSPRGAGQRWERLRQRNEQTHFQTSVHSGGLHRHGGDAAPVAPMMAVLITR
jgi:hypothetical protein